MGAHRDGCARLFNITITITSSIAQGNRSIACMFFGDSYGDRGRLALPLYRGGKDGQVVDRGGFQVLRRCGCDAKVSA